MKYFISAIFAGMMIAFGGVVFLSCAGLENGKVIGSFLFSLGLLTVVARGYDLYTGKVGYLSVNSKDTEKTPTNVAKTPLYYPAIILGNLVGTAIIGYAFRATRSFGVSGIPERLQTMCNAKLNDNLFSIFLLACACGVMMFLAVDGYKKTKSWLFVILPVMVFILCGFEHCVANMFYFCASDCWSVKTIVYVLVMILGNGVGAIIYKNIPREKK